MYKYKIVVVENDEDERMFMMESFNVNGMFDVLGMVKNGDHLLDWVEEHSGNMPDVILTDLNMPGKNGYDIIRYIKGHELYSDIPVIVTSTSSAQSIIDRCLDMGAADYLIKPDTFLEYGPYLQKLHSLLSNKLEA